MKFNLELQAPQMAKKNHVIKVHDQEIQDPYFWFREKELPEVNEHLHAENDYTEKQMAPLAPTQDEIWDELKGRIKEADESYPIKRGDYYYYSKDLAGKEYKVYCRKFNSRDAQEEVLLDLNKLAEGKDYLQLGDIKVTPDNKIMAYSLDYDGSEEFTIYFKNLDSNQVYPPSITGTYPSFQWANDNKTFYYLELDDKHRPNKVFKYELGSNPEKSELVFEEKDPDYHVHLSKSMSQNYIFVQIFSHATSEAWYLDASNPMGEFKIVSPRRKSVIYDLEDSGNDSFFVYTNDEATNFKILKAPIGEQDYKQWQEIIPHDENVYISGFEVFKNRILLTERVQGLLRIRDYDYVNNKWQNIPMPEENCDIGSYINYEFDSPCYYFSYSSLITPSSVLSYQFDNQQVEICKTKEVPTFNKDLYKTERIFAKSHDGTEVPISLMYKKDLPKDGKTPCYLYGYGSYGLNIPPYFRPNILSLIDRGFVYAIAHIRGSATMGRKWYENGKLQYKKNTFHDFIAAAEHLIKENYTYKKGLVICGGSAGGMLVGTTVNMRPDLFNAVIAHVPFVDVLNTMLDDSLPLTTIEYDEWGNPNELDVFNYIRSYSTYDNIEAKEYPHMYVTAGLNDPRVTYWEPAKWVAKLRELKTDNNLILLKTNMDAGHGGKTGRFESLKEYAQEYAFILASFEMI